MHVGKIRMAPTTKKKRTNHKRKKTGISVISGNGMIILAVGLGLVLLLVFFLFSGCGVSHKSAHSVVHSLIEAYESGKEGRILDCYGEKKTADDVLKAEVSARLAYFDAQGMKSIEIGQIDEMGEFNDVTFVYAIYRLILENEEKFPCLSVYAVRQEDKDYVVLSTNKITSEISEAAAESYTKFMTTDVYKDYLKDYNTFIKKNPGYEDTVAAAMGES